MRKLLLTIFVFVVVTVSLSAQTEFGIRSGYYNSSEVTNFDSRTRSLEFRGGGFYVGVFADMIITNRFSLQPEINYIGVPNGLNQIQVPVLGKYSIGKKVNLFLGPSIGFILNADEDKTTNLGIALGVSYAITKKLAIELRGDHDLSKFSRGSAGEYSQVHGWLVGLKYTLD